MSAQGKGDAVATLRRYGLLRVPVHVFDEARRVPAGELEQLFGEGTRLVARGASADEERNLPRLIGATPGEVHAWARRLPAHLSLVVQPYEHVRFSVELAFYTERTVAELVPGIWELDNRNTPVVLHLCPEHSALDAPESGLQPARFHSPATGHYEQSTRVDDWQLATVAQWVREHRDGLDALHQQHGGPFGMKLQYSSRYGLSPQNLRSTVPALSAWDAPTEAPTLNTIVSTAVDIPPGPLLLDVSVAREEHQDLSEFVERLTRAGTREVYLASGLLSHLAINLREAGLTVRGAHG